MALLIYFNPLGQWLQCTVCGGEPVRKTGPCCTWCHIIFDEVIFDVGDRKITARREIQTVKQEMALGET